MPQKTKASTGFADITPENSGEDTIIHLYFLPLAQNGSLQGDPTSCPPSICMYIAPKPLFRPPPYHPNPSNRIPEPLIPLQHHLPLIRLLITPSKIPTINPTDHNYQQLNRSSRVHPRSIIRRILRPEYKRARDATDAPKAHQRSGAESTFPLAPDVVGLVGHCGGDLGVGCAGDEEDAEVAHAVAFGEALVWC